MDTRPTFAEIDLRAIADNLKQVKQKVAPAKVMAVVKSDAYGHGLQAVSELAVANGASYLGVALVEEGRRLRSLGISCPVLVFGGFFEHQIEDFLRFGLDLTLFDLASAVILSQRAGQAGKLARVHIKVDTGMGRVGVHWREASAFVAKVAELRHVEIVALYTHLASSDEKDSTYARLQLDRFRAVVAKIEKQGLEIPIKHVANSGAILSLAHAHFDMVRLGVSMYGYYPSAEASRTIALKPAMVLKSRVIFKKEVDKDTYISYNRTHRTTRRTVIATVPIGYGDGYNRLLSNRGHVLIRGLRLPVVGLVCMDQIMVDLGPDSTVEIGDEVVLLGPQGNDEISMDELCKKLDTIPYEISCRISERVARVHIN